MTEALCSFQDMQHPTAVPHYQHQLLGSFFFLDHYLKSFFPKPICICTAPSDVYTQNQARDARQKAEMIFDMMTEVVQN